MDGGQSGWHRGAGRARAARPRLFQRGRKRGPLRRLGGAGALRHGAAGCLQLTPLMKTRNVLSCRDPCSRPYLALLPVLPNR